MKTVTEFSYLEFMYWLIDNGVKADLILLDLKKAGEINKKSGYNQPIIFFNN